MSKRSLINKISDKVSSNITEYLYDLQNRMVSAGYEPIEFASCGMHPISHNRVDYHTHIKMPIIEKHHPLLFASDGVGHIDIQRHNGMYKVMRSFNIGTLDSVLDFAEGNASEEDNTTVRVAISQSLKGHFQFIENLGKKISPTGKIQVIDSRRMDNIHDTREYFPLVFHTFEEDKNIERGLYAMQMYVSSLIHMKPEKVKTLQDSTLEKDLINFQKYFIDLRTAQQKSQEE